MRIRALVTSVRPGQASEKYPEPGVWVSLEGVSALIGKNCRDVPEAGKEIEAVVSVRWPKEKGGHPVHFIESFDPAV